MTDNGSDGEYKYKIYTTTRVFNLRRKKLRERRTGIIIELTCALNIAIVRATHACMKGSRIPTGRMSVRPDWEERGGFPLLASESVSAGFTDLDGRFRFHCHLH